MKSKKIILLAFVLLFSSACIQTHAVPKSDLHQRAEATDSKADIAKARSLYIHAFNDYANRGEAALGVECAVKATALYYKENFYKEAFDLLRRADQLANSGEKDAKARASLHYLTTKERLQMYIKMRKVESAKEQIRIMENYAAESGDESVKNDLLYNKAVYFYTFGLNTQGNAVFQEMASKLTGNKEYDKVDEVYQTLISNGRKTGNATMVAQTYNNYVAWKDSVNALKLADETGALKKQIADNEATIADKDSSLGTRMAMIIGLSILALALAVALAVGAVVLLRFIVLTRKQKKTIQLANASNALKAKFISNISAQLEPTLKKLNGQTPEVKALLEFTSHVQTLSELENSEGDDIELTEIPVASFCEALAEATRSKVKPGVTLTVNAPKMSANINKEYVTHILTHLLDNAAEYTPQGGTIVLDFKKRGAHTFQFLVSDTGSGIPEEKRDDIFKPFVEVHDLTQGDALGLPICKQMALKMKGDLNLDPQYTKGTRFVLELHG